MALHDCVTLHLRTPKHQLRDGKHLRLPEWSVITPPLQRRLCQGAARHGVAWRGVAWYSMVQHGVAWRGVAGARAAPVSN